MKQTRLWLAAAFTLMLLAAPFGARAAVVTGLYEASVPVPNQSAAARGVALQQALAAVLVKITGERSAASVPALAKLAQDPSQFLQQYRYDQAPAASTTAAPPVTYYDLTRTGAPAIALTGLLLSAKFDADLLNQAVRAANEPLWGAERPATLVWLTVIDASGTHILSAGGNVAVLQALQSAAAQRGVPLTFPSMDAVDQQAIGVPDITLGNGARVAAASARYKPDATLIGSTRAAASGTFTAHWQLRAGNETAAWNGVPADLASVAAEGVQVAADDYAKWFAIAPGANGLNGVALSVSGITGVTAYAKVLDYLGNLTPVKGVQVARVDGDTVYFSIDTRGSVQNLAQAVRLGGLLKSAAPAAVTAASAAAASLQFQYVQ
ncbi:MAG: DUF2066 domain-containing protein [Gammaproteobacteria bacterium]